MSDARWIEVDEDMAAASFHFRRSVELYDAGGFERPGLEGYRATMALQHAVQSGYTSLEAGLRRVLTIVGEEPPVGERSHADLVRRVSKAIQRGSLSRPAILLPDVADDIDEARWFRHRAAHDYDNFDPSRAGPAIDAVRRLAVRILPVISAFRAVIDPD